MELRLNRCHLKLEFSNVHPDEVRMWMFPLDIQDAIVLVGNTKNGHVVWYDEAQELKVYRAIAPAVKLKFAQEGDHVEYNNEKFIVVPRATDDDLPRGKVRLRPTGRGSDSKPTVEMLEDMQLKLVFRPFKRG